MLQAENRKEKSKRHRVEGSVVGEGPETWVNWRTPERVALRLGTGGKDV